MQFRDTRLRIPAWRLLQPCSGHTPAMSDPYRLHDLRVTGDERPCHAIITEAIDGLAGNKVRQAIVLGLVTVDDQPWHHPTEPLPAGEHRVQVDLRQGLKKASRGGRDANVQPFTIAYEDEYLVVVNKAAGILSAPTHSDEHGHVPELLRKYWRSRDRATPYIGVVHRIDQATSGCLCFALDRKVQPLLAQQFASHVAERRYHCLVAGHPKHNADTLTGRIGRDHRGRRAVVTAGAPGKEAITHFEVLEKLHQAALVAVRLETGRTHQIRVHLSSIGCPVLGDPVYGPQRDPVPAPRLMLHARELLLDHPMTGERVHVETDLPAVFEQVRKRLGAPKPG
jgi:23S rRNA pseudouridine1911/1915/1917 synthase